MSRSFMVSVWPPLIGCSAWCTGWGVGGGWERDLRLTACAGYRHRLLSGLVLIVVAHPVACFLRSAACLFVSCCLQALPAVVLAPGQLRCATTVPGLSLDTLCLLPAPGNQAGVGVLKCVGHSLVR